jgi:hypothetical protein
MKEEDFEGTLVLEKLAAIGEQEEFFEAVDSDNFKKAAVLLKRAGVDTETIQMVLQKMQDPE